MDVYYKIAFTSLIVFLVTTMIMQFQKEFPPNRWVMKLELVVWALSFAMSAIFVVISIWFGQ